MLLAYSSISPNGVPRLAEIAILTAIRSVADNAARNGNSANDDAMTAAVERETEREGESSCSTFQTAVNRLQHLVAAPSGIQHRKSFNILRYLMSQKLLAAHKLKVDWPADPLRTAWGPAGVGWL